jgi:hypothetical protein
MFRQRRQFKRFGAFAEQCRAAVRGRFKPWHEDDHAELAAGLADNA